MIPLALGAILLLAAIGVALSARRAPRGVGQRRPIDRGTQAWANEVRRRLPEAFDAQQITKAGPDRKGGRPRPTILGAGRPTEAGWEWRLNLPGNSQAEDWDAGRIAAALNRGDHIAAVAEIHHAGDGWAELQVFRSDPLATSALIPWAPGAMPSCCEPGTVCMGRQRNGDHIHFDVVTDVGATASLFAGRRGSGKSEAIRLMMAQMVAWGWASPYVIDLVRRGVDYEVFAPLLARPVITDPKEALAVIKGLRAECSARADDLKAAGRQKITRYTRDLPLLPLIIDEAHAVNAIKPLKAEMVPYTQETRPLGGGLVYATQYPTVDNVDPTLRLQIANVWCGRVRNAVEAGVVFGPLPEGVGPHHLRSGPGSCIADVDGPDLLTGRGWRMPAGWLAAHVRALSAVRV
jgi:hypothetical protein